MCSNNLCVSWKQILILFLLRFNTTTEKNKEKIENFSNVFQKQNILKNSISCLNLFKFVTKGEHCCIWTTKIEIHTDNFKNSVMNIVAAVMYQKEKIEIDETHILV